jgi:hypothetical protein
MTRGARRLKLTGDRIAAIGLASFGAGIVWYALLMRPILAAAAYGPVCGHASLFAPHCAPCYAALAMVAAGLGLLALAETRCPRAAIQSAR